MRTAKHIADRIRLLIAVKQFQVGDVLPSTREMGRQLDSSFHTVRKAYQMLEQEGLLRGERGRGFVVDRQNTRFDKQQRLEKGAEQLRSVLEELISYGLDEEEVEMLFQEQLNFIEWPERLESCATVGHTQEQGQMLAQAIKKDVGVDSEIITGQNTGKAVNYDALFVPIPLYRAFRREGEGPVLLPVFYSLDAELMISIVERSSVQDLGLVTRDEESVAPIIEELKLNLRFPGSMLAGSTYGKSLPLFVRDVDLVVYTAGCATMVEKQIPEKQRLKLEYDIHPHTVDLIRSELWDQ